MKFTGFRNLWYSFTHHIPLGTFAALMSVLTLLCFYGPFWQFVASSTNLHSLNGMVLLSSLVLVVLVANYFAYCLFLYLFRIVAKGLLSLTLVLNATAVYFIYHYGVIIDETMVGNVFNTDWNEASSYWSFSWLGYVLVLGVLPSFYVFHATINYGSWKSFLKRMGISAVVLLVLVFANASNWLWIDKYSTELGALTMPWSYIVNTCRYYTHVYQANQKEILLPDAHITNTDKEVFVLVIGESDRRANFSLYGYNKNTNPLLSKTEHIHCFKGNSSSTYTTASVKSILDYKPTDELYEILPNYLYRNGVEVIWRSSNWGEPPLHIPHVKNLSALMQEKGIAPPEYDEYLLDGLQEEILKSDKNKVLVVLHLSTSHGPQYSKKYPPAFEQFTPVCRSVELADCTSEELLNAYDNTIVYTDYLLHQLVEMLQACTELRSAMFFVPDHGESLGEHNLYMHGVPIRMAPKEQYEIPFILWTSENRALKPNEELTQYYVFHSVLRFLHIESPVYDADKDIFQ